MHEGIGDFPFCAFFGDALAVVDVPRSHAVATSSVMGSPDFRSYMYPLKPEILVVLNWTWRLMGKYQ